jgi:FkbM family methyltransferase
LRFNLAVGRFTGKLPEIMPTNDSLKQPLPSPESIASEPAPKIFRAPNGLEIFYHGSAEANYVYHEIFEERIYFRHGINLLPGESVFDIGANIGLFTIFVEENFPGTRVHAFEPSPRTFEILRANVSRYGEAVSLHHCGIAGRAGEALFTFYPNYSIMSGFHSEGDHDQSALRAGIKSHLKEQGIENPQERFVGMMLKQALQEKQEIVCRLETISGIMDSAGIEKLGLLKIDAEGSELDILAGIRDNHWHSIRQIVMEVHDANEERRLHLKTLLERHGYACTFEQEQRLAGTGIVNCYASRH